MFDVDTYNCPLHNRTVQNCFFFLMAEVVYNYCIGATLDFLYYTLNRFWVSFCHELGKVSPVLQFYNLFKKKRKATDFNWKGKWCQSITSGCIRFAFLSVADVSNRFQPFRFYWTSWFQKVLLDKGRAHLLCSSFLWRCRHINISVLSLTICRSWIDDINNENAIKQTSLCIIFHVLGWSYTFLHAY